MIDESEIDASPKEIQQAKKEVVKEMVSDLKGPDYCPNCGEEL
ncbi:MAG: hypothetical protein ABEK04_02005 [Candidatus Nanohalobium sp.]